jgi:hypothetical protein
MIRKFKPIIVAAGFGALAFLSACKDDFLKEDALGQLTNEGFPANVQQLEEAVHGMYNAASRFCDQAAIVTRNCGTEQLCGQERSNKFYQESCDKYDIHIRQHSLGEPRDRPIWDGAYAGVKQANWLLESVGNAMVSDPKVLELAKGQAYFIRALMYFNLVRYFGDVPLILTSDINYKVAALSKPNETYEAILADLEQALTRLPAYAWNAADPNVGSAATAMPALWKDNRALPTQGWLRALRSQIYLTMAGWPLNTPAENPNLAPQNADAQALYALSAADAEWVIDHKAELGYKLEEDFKDLWLYETQFTESEGLITMFYHRDGHDEMLAPQSGRPRSEPGEPWNGWGDYMIERPFFFSFPESYRKEISFTKGWYINRRNREKDWVNWYDKYLTQDVCFYHPYLSKWRSTAQFPFDSLWVDNTYSERAISLMRYANVLFNYAEASTRATWTVNSKAIEAVNQVRRRAQSNPKNSRYPINVVDINSPNETYDLPSGLSVTQFLDSLLLEKSYEFVGEPESRWFDLVRLDEVYEVALKVKAQRAATQNTTPGDESLPTSDYLHPYINNLKEIEIPTDRNDLHLYEAPLYEILNNSELFNY